MFRPAVAVLILGLCAGLAHAQDVAADNDGWTLGKEEELQEFYFKPAPGSGRYGRLWARYELFDETGGYRSIRALEEFDCGIPAKRTREITFYRQPGLVGPLSTRKSTTPWRLTHTEDMDDESLQIVCDGKKARTPAAVAALAAELGAGLSWPPLEPLGWEETASGSKAFKLFTRAEPGAPSRIWMRLERPQPVADVRSQTQLFEADCAGRKVRVVQRVTYAQNNLKGEAKTDAGPTAWTEPAERSVSGRALTAVCEAG